MNIIMPQLGETVSEGTVSTWFKQVGDTVAEGEALFEIETDKVTMEVTATQAGTLSEIRVQPGESAPVGAVVAVIGDGAAAPKQAAGTKAAQDRATSVTGASADTPGLSSTAGPGAGPARGGNGATRMEPFREVRTPERQFGPAEAPGGIKVTPLARRMIALEGLDLQALAQEAKARGAWRIGKSEVKAALDQGRGAAEPQARAPAARLEPRPDEDVVPLNSVQRTTGRNLAASWSQVPHVVQAVEVDFGRLEAVRAARKESFRQTHGIGLSYLPFIARALVLAIAEFPRVNARYDSDRLLVSRRVHLGIAIDLSHEGLVVPVVRNADELNVTGFANAVARLVEKARAGELTPGDLSGATYTISNNGSFGTLFTAPIIAAPQVAILSTDAVRKRPVVVETEAGDAIMARPVGVLAQSFDHRAFDGAYSAAFLARLKELIETRDWAAEFA